MATPIDELPAWQRVALTTRICTDVLDEGPGHATDNEPLAWFLSMDDLIADLKVGE